MATSFPVMRNRLFTDSSGILYWNGDQTNNLQEIRCQKCKGVVGYAVIDSSTYTGSASGGSYSYTGNASGGTYSMGNNPIGGSAIQDGEHYFVCKACGQAIKLKR